MKRIAHGCVVALVGVCLAGCSIPPGDQDSARGAHDKLLTARASGDLDQQWALLHPEIKDLFGRWLSAEREAVKATEMAYPEGTERQEVLRSMAGGKRAQLPDGRALFSTLIATTAAEPLSMMEILGSRPVYDLADAPDKAELMTLAGQRFLYRQGDDEVWYAWPSEDEKRSLTEAVAAAETNQKTAVRNSLILKGSRP